MKFSTATLAFLLALHLPQVFSEELECTHGKLYLVDDTTSNLYIMDVASGDLEDLTSVQDTLSLPKTGAGQLVLQSSGSGGEVAVMYRGNETLGYEDGYVRFVNTGVDLHEHDGHYDVEYDPPSLIDNASFDCARAIHYVRHDNKIAIFCDGSYDSDPQVNSTVWVLDETKFGSSTESALVFTETLQGSHHGVAVPVDDGHVLYSLAHENRTNRESNADEYALPETFQVVDYQGGILHEIADATSKDASCSGFHGSTAVDNTFALACDADHGGVVVVDYDENSNAYTSRALMYPTGENFTGLRVGSFDEHVMADHVVGSFSLRGGTNFYLMAFSKTDTAVTTENILTLPDRQCGYYFELGRGEVVMVFMPTGALHAFQFKSGAWKELAQEQVVPGMTACSEATFVPGVAQAFITTTATKTLYAVNMAHVDDGEMTIYTSTLPFTPAGMVVSGLAKQALCDGTETDDHNHGKSGAKAVSSIGALVVLSSLFVLLK